MKSATTIVYKLDICGCARRWIGHHGDKAVDEAERMAEDALQAGNDRSHAMWMRIRHAVSQVLDEQRCSAGSQVF